MTSSLTLPPLGSTPDFAPVTDDPVRRQVWEVLAGLYPGGRNPERRTVQRFPYPQLMYLTPVGEDLQPMGEPVAVIGKHLSERGLGFYHLHPLPYRHMIASLQMARSQWAGFLIDVKWTRFTQFGWYDSGGNFLQAVPSPIAPRAV